MFNDTGQTNYDVNFTLFKIPIRINPFFWLIALFFSPFLSMQIVNMRIWLIGLIAWMLAWLASFLIHEFGHALIIQRVYGARPWIILYGFGGLACHQPYYTRIPGPLGRILISFAGPAAELLASIIVVLLVILLCGFQPYFTFDKLGALPIPLVTFNELYEWMTDSQNFLKIFFGWFIFSFLWMGFFWSILNLLPVHPLDGGNIAREFSIRMDPHKGLINSLWISIICSGTLAFFCILEGSIFAAFLFGYFAYNNYQELQGRNYSRF